MPLVSLPAAEALARIDRFDRVIDARSESEFAEDRLPGAVNWPTLNDAERHRIGTEYVQVSAFEARKHGAVIAARNIAAHIERELSDVPRDWQPLVYCWRGGQRSGALSLVLSQIGFRVHVVEGGYQACRRAILSLLETLPQAFDYRVLCGVTGSGKSRLLQALRRAGAQVVDLEALANHRGSVLGLVPGSPQPSQKAFDTRVWDALRGLDASRPVWIEAESKKVGALRVPDALVAAMRAAPCVAVEMAVDARVRLLMEDYDFFVRDVAAFCARLDALRALRGNEQINAWQALAHAGQLDTVVRELLQRHYDPIYRQSTAKNFAGFGSPAGQIRLADGSAEAMDAAALRLIA